MGTRVMAVGLLATIAAFAARPTESVAQNTRQFPSWGIEYDMPPDWYVAQTAGRMHVLSSRSETGSIFIAPGLYEDLDDVLLDLDAFAQMANLIGEPVEGPTEAIIAGYPGVFAAYDGNSRSGDPVRARLAAVFTEYGTGVVVLGLTTPDWYPVLRETIDRIAMSVAARPPEIDQQVVEALAGTWANYRTGKPPSDDVPGERPPGIDDLFEFDGIETFVWKSAIYLAAEARGRIDDPSLAGQESDHGRYTVIGRRLIFKGQSGQRSVALELQGDRLRVGERTYFRKQ